MRPTGGGQPQGMFNYFGGGGQKPVMAAPLQMQKAKSQLGDGWADPADIDPKKSVYDTFKGGAQPAAAATPGGNYTAAPPMTDAATPEAVAAEGSGRTVGDAADGGGLMAGLGDAAGADGAAAGGAADAGEALMGA